MKRPEPLYMRKSLIARVNKDDTARIILRLRHASMLELNLVLSEANRWEREFRAWTLNGAPVPKKREEE